MIFDNTSKLSKCFKAEYCTTNIQKIYPWKYRGNNIGLKIDTRRSPLLIMNTVTHSRFSLYQGPSIMLQN